MNDVDKFKRLIFEALFDAGVSDTPALEKVYAIFGDVDQWAFDLGIKQGYADGLNEGFKIGYSEGLDDLEEINFDCQSEHNRENDFFQY